MKKKRDESQRENLFDLVPQRNIKWEKKEDGLIVLLKEKFQNPLLKKYLLSRLKNPYFRVKLDKIGSFVWEQCDGKNNIKEIADLLHDKFGEDIEPVYERISLFFQNLENSRFIVFHRSYP